MKRPIWVRASGYICRGSAIAVGAVLLVVAGCGGGASSSGGGGTGNAGTNVTFQFTGATPTAVATQLGSGAFTVVAPASTVSFEVPSGTTKFAVAYVCPAVQVTSGSATNQLTAQTVIEATVSDGTSYAYRCTLANAAGTTGDLTVSSDASAISGATQVSLQAENSKYFAQEVMDTVSSSHVFAAPAGTDRVDVVALSRTISNGVLILNALAVKSFTGQAVPGSLNGGDTVVLGAEDLTTPQGITYTGLPSGYGTPLTEVDYTPTGLRGAIVVALDVSSQYPALPATVTQSGGSYTLEALSWSTTNSAEQVKVTENFTTGGTVAVAFPAAWTYAGPTAAALPTMDFSYSGFAGKSGVSDEATLNWLSGSNAQNSYIVQASQAYLAGSTKMSLPNLGGISGFFGPPASGTTVSWEALINQSDGGSLQSLGADSTRNTVYNEGIYTVP